MENTKNFKARRLILLITIVVEILLVLLLLTIISRSVTINTDKSVVFADSDYVDDISYSDGLIVVNNVQVHVPDERNVAYNISYAWGKNDKQYPTVPQSVSASFLAPKGDTSKYDLVLYRESFTPNEKIDKGMNVSNWFNDWESIDDEMSKQSPRSSGDIKGFQISTIGSETNAVYNTSSFYFPVQEEDGISVYVLEGLLYDNQVAAEFNNVLDNAISSIKINNKS